MAATGPAAGTLDRLPSPYLTGVFDVAGLTELYLNISRGCPLTCQFCSIGLSEGEHFSLSRIEAELRLVAGRARGLRRVYCVTFDLLDHPDAPDLLRLFADVGRRRGVDFRFDINVSKLQNEALVPLLDCERFWIDVGIQSLEPDALQNSGRNKQERRIKDGVARARRLAPRAHLVLGFIRGLPGDTARGFQRTLDWALSTGCEVKINHLRVLPGTGFGDRPGRHELVAEPRYPYFAVSCRTFPKDDMDAMVALTNRLGFVWELMKYDPLVKETLIELGSASPGERPHLETALGFLERLERSGRFARELEAYRRERESDADPREFELGDVPFRLLTRAPLWEALAAFRRERVPGLAPSRKLEDALARGRARQAWLEASPARSAAARRLLEAVARPDARLLLVCWEGSSEAQGFAGEALCLRDDVSGRSADVEDGPRPVTLEELRARLESCRGRRYDGVIVSGTGRALAQAAALPALTDCLSERGWALALAPSQEPAAEWEGLRPLGRPASASAAAVSGSCEFSLSLFARGARAGIR